MVKHTFSLFIIFLFCSSICSAQFDVLSSGCKKNFPSDFVSDGQEYYASLKPDQKIEFKTTFFGNNTYRLAACTNLSEGHLTYSIYDTDKNLLFTNENHDYSPFWNFSFTSTITCIIQVEMKSDKFRPGYVMLLIGYKQ